MIDHECASRTLRERLFKELLSNFFPEFIELFFPDISAYWERDSIEFLPQEVFTDVTEGDDLFATRSQYFNNLSGVLRILKHLGRIITKS